MSALLEAKKKELADLKTTKLKEFIGYVKTEVTAAKAILARSVQR